MNFIKILPSINTDKTRPTNPHLSWVPISISAGEVPGGEG